MSQSESARPPSAAGRSAGVNSPSRGEGSISESYARNVLSANVLGSRHGTGSIVVTDNKRSRKQELQDLVSSLRGRGLTWSDIAAIISRRYEVNARVAFRMAHGMSQADVAEEWTKRWPSDAKTFKNVSYWEQWPGPTGYAPSFDVLDKLAQIYQCSVSDLLTDYSDYSHSDDNYAGPGLIRSPFDPSSCSEEQLSRSITQLCEEAKDMDLQDLSRLASHWIRKYQPERDSSSLLLRLSAALRLAVDGDLAARVIDERESFEPWPNTSRYHDLAGIWHSRYTYTTSTEPDKPLTAEHYVVIRQQRGSAVVESLPHSLQSRLTIQLAIDGVIATGVWREQTSPRGKYKGATYHGAIQFIIDPRGRHMEGKWLGFNSKYHINVGEWELTWLESSTSKTSQRKYHLKV